MTPNTASVATGSTREKQTPPPRATNGTEYVKRRLTSKFVRFRAVLQTIMDQDGYILFSDIIPSDTIEFAKQRFGELWHNQLIRGKKHTACVYIDNVGKYRNE
jgi:hypothetical protein